VGSEFLDILTSRIQALAKLKANGFLGSFVDHTDYQSGQLPRSPFERSLCGGRFRVLGVGSVTVSG
jgi:hypothetical protein